MQRRGDKSTAGNQGDSRNRTRFWPLAHALHLEAEGDNSMTDHLKKAIDILLKELELCSSRTEAEIEAALAELEQIEAYD